MVANWEYSYNGLTFGGATVYGVNETTGIRQNPDVRQDINDRVGRHGSYSYTQLYDKRMVTIAGDMTASTAALMESQIDAMKLAFAAQLDPLPLVFKRPGMAGSGQQRLLAKPLKVDVPLDTAYSILYGTWAVQFLCDDPIIYDDSVNTTTITNTAGTGSLNNVGITPILFENVRITGPGTDFTVRINGSTTNQIVINDTLTAGNYLDVDFQDRTIFNNASSSRYFKLNQASSKWWELPVGTTTVQFVTGSGATVATKIDITWRPGWL